VIQESLAKVLANFHELADPRPAISILVHFREDDREELAALAAMIVAQDYPRAELIVTAEPAARALADMVAKLPGNVKFFLFDDPIVKAEAWNRAIRESFAELLLVIEPGDRLEPGALQTLSDELSASKALYVVPAGVESLRPPRGVLMEKNAFRQCGLFCTDPLHQGREHQEWFQRLERNGVCGSRIASVPLRAIRPSEPIRISHTVDWKSLREQWQRRGKTLE
jgi:cellulose synthase/poly-beta-1,6-N-acetylglucosamine synthase-like glycosyltransferase